MAPLVGLEPTTYRLLHYTYFHKHYNNIICSLDFIFTISFDLGRWCKVSTHSFRLARYYRVFLLTNSTDLATFFIYKFPYRAANFNLGRFASQPSALPTELTRNLYKSGNNLSFQQGNPQVFSALFGLTSVFGMGTGITQVVIVTRKLITN